MGFLTENMVTLCCFCFFVNFLISPLTLLCCHSLTICASNGDNGSVYSPFWTSGLQGYDFCLDLDLNIKIQTFYWKMFFCHFVQPVDLVLDFKFVLINLGFSLDLLKPNYSNKLLL